MNKLLLILGVCFCINAQAIIPKHVLDGNYKKDDFYEIMAPYWGAFFESYSLRTYKVKSLKNIFIASIPRDATDKYKRGNHIIVRTTDNYATRYPDDFEILEMKTNTQGSLKKTLCEYQSKCRSLLSKLGDFDSTRYKDQFASSFLSSFDQMFEDKFVGKDFEHIEGIKKYNIFVENLRKNSPSIQSYTAAMDLIENEALKTFSPFYQQSSTEFLIYLKDKIRNLEGSERKGKMNELFSYYYYGQAIKDILNKNELYYKPRLVPIACKTHSSPFCQVQRLYQNEIDQIFSDLYEFDENTYRSYPFSSNFYSYAMKKK